MAEIGQDYSILTTLTETDYVVTGLTAGTTYKFKVEARNQFDYSDFSGELSLLCATLPEVPVSISTVIEQQQVKVTWTLPSDNGSPITNYRVFVKEI